jgi:hypothetical protein
MKNKLIKSFLTLLLIFVLCVASGGYAAQSGVEAFIYFYNPETTINNFATLKTAFDSYLAERGNYRFQPFNDKTNFETVLKQDKGHVYLLSSWHFEALQQQGVPLEMALIGTAKGNGWQRKVLSAKKDLTTLAMLKNSVVAGAGSEDYIRSVLAQIIGKSQDVSLQDIKILTVPKDIDAVMAVSFGMASAAIASENSLTKLAIINPNQFQQLHSLGFSEKSHLLIAATLKKPEAEEIKVLKLLQGMSANSEGSKNLRLLGIDGWKPL